MDFEPEDDEGGDDALYAYVFVPRPTLDGVVADRFMDVSVMVGHTADTWGELIATYRAMGMDKDNITDLENRVDTVRSIFLRSKFNMDGASVHLVKCAFPLTGEDVDALLASKQRDGTLAQFLRQSRIG